MNLLFFKENKYFDIVYRFILWFSIAFTLFSIGELLDSAGYPNLKNIISIPQKHDFVQLIGVIGLFVGGIALLIKEIALNSSHESIVFYLLSKISTDLVLAPFNIMAFVLGWGAFLCTNGALNNQHSYMLIFLLIPFILIMIALAMISLVVRAKPGEYIFNKVYTIPRMARVLLSMTLICCSTYAITIGFVDTNKSVEPISNPRAGN